jgi:hypothetical protein
MRVVLYARVSTTDTEVFDSAIVMGDSILPIEIKSSILPVEQKYAGEAGPFYQGISARFGTGEGARLSNY